MGATLCDVVYGFPPPTTSHRSGGMFPFFTNQLIMRLIIVANCSLLLQLTLDFFLFSSVFTRGLIHARSLEDIVTVLKGRYLSIEVIRLQNNRIFLRWSYECSRYLNERSGASIQASNAFGGLRLCERASEKNDCFAVYYNTNPLLYPDNEHLILAAEKNSFKLNLSSLWTLR